MSHLSIIGAGAVGVACASSIVHARLASRVSLYDVQGRKAEGEALDFAHAAPLLGHLRVDGGGMERLEPAELCIITAGAKQRPGETRLELLTRNAAALDAIADAVEARGLPKVALVITNPVDVMTQLLRERWRDTGVAVLGTGTLLDTMRLRARLGEQLEVSPDSVHATVLGEHGDSAVPLLDSARIGGLPLEVFAARRGRVFGEAERAAVVASVRGAAGAVIERKGATCHAIGLVTARIVRALVRDEQAVLTVTAPVDDGVCAGVPCLVGKDGAATMGLPEMSANEAADFEASLQVLRDARTSLGRRPAHPRDASSTR